MKICKIKDCDNIYLAKGYCQKHYARVWRYGESQYTKIERNHAEHCSIIDCNEKYLAKGYCRKHYKRFKKYGDPQYTKHELHGMENTREYGTWISMRKRCYNIKHKSYKRYGGRGISVCDRWKNSFIAFFEDMGSKPFPKAQIDRIDNDGNYKKENCRWTSCVKNNRNSSKAKLTMQKAEEIKNRYKNDGITQKELGNNFGVSRSTIGHVINKRTWKSGGIL